LSETLKKAIAFSYINAEKEIPRSLDPWYDEVDLIIALDGRYKTPLSPAMKKKYSDPKLNYSQDNSDHILKTRYGDKLIYEKFYGTELEKRQRSFDIADQENIDIVIVWDSDEYIHPDYQDFNQFHKQIDHVLIKHPNELILRMQAYIPDTEIWCQQHNLVTVNSWRTYDRIHINPSVQRYAFSHYTWTRKNVTDKEIEDWLFDTKNKWTFFAECPLFIWPIGIIIDGIRIGMDRKFRTAEQIEHGNEYHWQTIHEETYKYQIQPFYRSIGQRTIGDLGEYYFDNEGKCCLHDPSLREKAITGG
jgi:hypothetical protein